MHITFFSNINQPCGIADYSRNLITELEKHVSVEVVALPGDLKPDGSLRSYLSCAYRFFQLGRRMNHGDVCHIQHEFAFWGNFYPRTNLFPFFAWGIKVPIVMTAHELIDPPFRFGKGWTGVMRPVWWFLSPLLRRYERYVNSALFAWPDRTIVHTAEQKRQLVVRGVCSHKIVVMPHGIPSIDTLGHDENYLEQCGLQGRRYFTLVGFLTERKGYDLILDVLGRIPEDIVFVIAGGARVEEDHVYAEKLRARIEREGLGSRVHLTGYLEPAQLASVLASATAVVAPFERVSGSGSLSLALAAGRAVVASDIGPLRDLQRETGALLLYTPGDSNQLLNCLLTVFDDNLVRSGLENAAKSYAYKNSFKLVANKTIQLYEDILRETH